MSFRLHFLSVGPSRSASSWLDEALRASPQLHLPEGVKETMFFDQRYDRGLDWYTWHFREASPEQRCGEVGSSYFLSADARERLKSRFPDTKIIVHLREPVSRAISMYMHHLRRGRVSGGLRAAAATRPDIVDGSRYATHAPAWERDFDVHYVSVDAIAAQPVAVLNGVADFLGIDRYRPADLEQAKNVETGVPKYPLIAKLVSRAATRARALRLHRLAEFGKRLGLKRLYTSAAPAEAEPVEPSDRRWLESELATDIDAYHALLARAVAR